MLIDAVRKLIICDHHVTYGETETSLIILRTHVHSILHHLLKVKQVYSRWILHKLSQVENYSCEMVPRKSKKLNSSALNQQKLLKDGFCIFRKFGYNIYQHSLAIATISLGNRKKVNTPWYSTICLEKIVVEPRKRKKNF